MERLLLMVELESWVREAQDRLDAELGAVMSVGREQRSCLKKASSPEQCSLSSSAKVAIQHTNELAYLPTFLQHRR